MAPTSGQGQELLGLDGGQQRPATSTAPAAETVETNMPWPCETHCGIRALEARACAVTSTYQQAQGLLGHIDQSGARHGGRWHSRRRPARQALVRCRPGARRQPRSRRRAKPRSRHQPGHSHAQHRRRRPSRLGREHQGVAPPVLRPPPVTTTSLTTGLTWDRPAWRHRPERWSGQSSRTSRRRAGTRLPLRYPQERQGA